MRVGVRVRARSGDRVTARARVGVGVRARVRVRVGVGVRVSTSHERVTRPPLGRVELLMVQQHIPVLHVERAREGDVRRRLG